MNAPPTVQATSSTRRATPATPATPRPRRSEQTVESTRLADLERRVAQIEQSTLVSNAQVPSNLRDFPEYNSFLQIYLKEAYNALGEEWDLDGSLQKNATNKRILQRIKERALANPFFRESMGLLNTGGMSRNQDKVVTRIIRNQLNHLKRVLKERDLPEEKKTKVNLDKKMNQRKKRKLENRKKEFGRMDDQLHVVLSGEEPLPKEECALLLVKEAMSDEEDDELVRDTVAMTFLVKRPKWRSEKVNKLFQHLDDLHVRNIRQHYQQKERSAVEEVEVELSAELRRILPSWAIKE
ncbi:unnamed protein product [Mucor hiemalis]